MIGLGLATAPQEANLGACHGLKSAPFGAIADDHQRQAGAIEGFHHHFHPLVGHKPAEAQVHIVAALVPAEALHRDWRMQNLGRTAPIPADATGGETGIGHQHIGTTRAGHVPLTQPMELQSHQGAQGATGQAGMAQVGPHLIPGVANRGMHVTDMQLVWPREHPFGHQMAATEHQGVGAEIKLLDR